MPKAPRYVQVEVLFHAEGGVWYLEADWKDTADSALIEERLTATYSGVAPTPEQVMVSATPGFHDRYPKGFDLLPHRDGKTLRESLEVCMEGPWDLVQLVTWNDYGEGTILEPTHEFGYRSSTTARSIMWK